MVEEATGVYKRVYFVIHLACLYGFIPANGMLYTTPNDCSCQFLAKLTGLGALAPASTDPAYPPTVEESLRLEKGPAFDLSVPANPQGDDWPVYRHDQARSGYTTNARPGIFACRPAPIQVNYIGSA